jgi:hypothetical protein
MICILKNGNINLLRPMEQAKLPFRFFLLFFSFHAVSTQNILFATELNRQLCEEAKANGEDSPRVLVNSLHPGAINTNLMRYMPGSGLMALGRPFMKNVGQGAGTTMVAAASPKVTEGGLYLSDGGPARPKPYAVDLDRARRLWELSLQAVGLGEGSPAAAE